ncbi:8363_t:CDS:2, partial [Funneliformis geosporum]
ERLRIKHNAPKKNKDVIIQDCKDSDDDQEFNVNHGSSFQMNDYAKNQENFDTNKQPLYRLPRSQLQLPIITDDNTRGVYNFECLQENEEIIPKSKKHGSQNLSYLKYKAKLQEKARRKQEFELIRKQVIKEETNRRVEIKQKQRKENHLALQEAKIRETMPNEDTIDDEYKEIRKHKRRERMAEIARESRNLSMNVSEEQDDENVEYWENLTPDNIGWSDFLLMSKENDQSRGTLNTNKSYNYQGNVSNALASELSFNQIWKERYISQPAIDENEAHQQFVNDGAAILTHPKVNEAELAGSIGSRAPNLQNKSLRDQKALFLLNDSQPTLQTIQQSFQPKPLISVELKTNLQSNTEQQSNQLDLFPRSLDQKFSSNQPKLPKNIQEGNSISNPFLENPTQSLHLHETLSRQNYVPQSIAKVQNWLEHSEEFNNPEKNKNVESFSQIPSNDTDEGNSSSEDTSSDDDDTTNDSSKKLLDLLSKIRSTKKKIESRANISLERHQRTLESMQKIVADLIEKYEVFLVNGKKMKNGKKHIRELLNTITGKHTRDIIDALSLSLDRPSNDFDATSNSSEALLRQLQKAIEGFKRVEVQLTRKEKRLEIALEVAQCLVDKRSDLINWERRLKKQEQSINDMASRVDRSENSNEINHQNDESGYFGSVLGSFFRKNDNGMDNMIKTREEDASLISQHIVYTEEDWEKILVRLTPESEKNEFISDNEFEINEQKQCKNEDLKIGQDVKNDTTTVDVNQMTSLDHVDDYQQNIKDDLSKIDHNDSSAINAECFRTTEEDNNFISRSKLEDVGDSDSDSDQEELMSSFNGSNFTNKNIGKCYQRTSSSWVNDDQVNKAERKFGGIFANLSQTSSEKDFTNDEFLQKFNSTINGSMEPDHINISKSAKFNPVIPQIPENTQNEAISESPFYMNTTLAPKELEIPNANIEGTREKEKSNFLESSDNVNDNNESGLDFSEIINSLPGWKSFVSMVKKM